MSEGLELSQPHADVARKALDWAYCCNYGEGLASCVLRARGEIFAGASVALQMGPMQPGGLSPLSVALVALGAKGGRAEDVESVDWVAGVRAQVVELCRWDEELLQAVAPGKAFRVL